MIPKENEDEYGYNYKSLWKVIIRPPRAKYNLSDLAEKSFRYKSKMYQRTDYTIVSFQGHFIKASFIQPDEGYRPLPTMPVVIYLHGNSSSRIEGFNNKRFLLSNDINMFIFDFPACGHSEGEYISLGYHEQKDMKIIVDFVAKLPGVGRIGLWGRSMGAATALLYASKDERIKCVCADSAFADFTRLVKEIVDRIVKVPNFAVDGALKVIAKTIRSKNGMDIHNVRPIDEVVNATIPGMFIHGMQDQLIYFQHSIDLCEAYGGMKYMRPCIGGHNSIRPDIIMDDLQRFFIEYLKEKSVKVERKVEVVRELKDVLSSEEMKLIKNSIEEPNQGEEELKSIMSLIHQHPEDEEEDNKANEETKDTKANEIIDNAKPDNVDVDVDDINALLSQATDELKEMKDLIEEPSKNNIINKEAFNANKINEEPTKPNEDNKKKESNKESTTNSNVQPKSSLSILDDPDQILKHLNQMTELLQDPPQSSLPIKNPSYHSYDSDKDIDEDLNEINKFIEESKEVLKDIAIPKDIPNNSSDDNDSEDKANELPMLNEAIKDQE